MKLTVDKAGLHKALARAVSVVERRNTIPILSNVLIEADGEDLWLTATDLDIEVRVRAPASVETPGAITAPAGLLSDIVRNAPDGAEIALAFDKAADPRLIVKFGRSRYQVPVLPAGDYPRFAEANWRGRLDLPAIDLRQAIGRCDFSMSTEEVRHYLKGAFLHIHREDGVSRLRLVGTDGHRLAFAEFGDPGVLAGLDLPGVIIPAKTIRELGRALVDVVGDIAVDVAPNIVRFTIGEATIRSKVVDGAYPDYIRLIPRSWTHEIILPRQVLAGAVQRVALVSNERARSVKLSFEREVLTLQVRNLEAGAAVEEIAIDHDGEPFEIGFNARYLLDALGQTEAAHIVFRASTPGDPTRLEPEPADVEHGQALSILMPLRV